MTQSPPTRSTVFSFPLCALLAALAPGSASSGSPVQNEKYAPFTLVLYNGNAEESRKLAAYYAEQRSIPLDNVISFDVPSGEVISREDYNTKIRDPLRQRFEADSWWERAENANGDLVPVKNKMKLAAIMYGMPLKIEATPAAPPVKIDPKTGKTRVGKADPRRSDAASLDSELAVFGVDLEDIEGPGANSYFRANDAFGKPEILLTARVAARSFVDSKRLIDDAIATEKAGLWGMALIDIANLVQTKGPGYEVGDRWLETCAGFYHKAGIPVLVDRSPALVPSGYPLPKDVVLYFGWYSGRVGGVFADPDYRFKRGAIACHLHSLSASSMKPIRRFWTSPLINKGACAVMGNVYEPFLTMTTHFDMFNARLLAGFTFAEAGWMASPAVSWMTILVGDPLYQPYRGEQKYDMKTSADYKAFRIAVRRWGANPEELMANLARAAESMKSPGIIEMAGLHLLGAKDHAAAAAKFIEAKSAYREPADRLRQDLHRARALAEGGDEKAAVALLRGAASEFKDIPGAAAAVALSNQLDPPPPPPPR